MYLCASPPSHSFSAPLLFQEGIHVGFLLTAKQTSAALKGVSLRGRTGSAWLQMKQWWRQAGGRGFCKSCSCSFGHAQTLPSHRLGGLFSLSKLMASLLRDSWIIPVCSDGTKTKSAEMILFLKWLNPNMAADYLRLEQRLVHLRAMIFTVVWFVLIITCRRSSREASCRSRTTNT